MTEQSDKARATIIAKHGSWEAYKQQRYLDPLKAEQRSKVARLGGRASKGGGFNDPLVALKAAKLSAVIRRKP